MTSSQLHHDVNSGSVAQFFLLTAQASTTVAFEPTNHTDLTQLLQEFRETFGEPESLPPVREIDHQIPLIPGSAPVLVRP